MREDEWPNAAIFVCTRRVNTRVICQKIKRDVIQMTAETIAGRSSLNNVSKYIHIYIYIYTHIETNPSLIIMETMSLHVFWMIA